MLDKVFLVQPEKLPAPLCIQIELPQDKKKGAVQGTTSTEGHVHKTAVMQSLQIWVSTP